MPGGYDLRSPRVCVNQATDDSERGKLIGRLGGAHNNREYVLAILRSQLNTQLNTRPPKSASSSVLENFAFIACAVVIAKQSGISSALIDARAAYYAASRVLYLCFYTVSSTPALGLARALVFVAGGVIMGDLYLRAARVY